MTHWATNYLGLPWVKGQHECGHFFCAVQKAQFGLDVQVIDADAMSLRSCIRALNGEHPEFQNWREVSDPQEGDCVRLSHSKHPHHVGVWVDVDGGGVLHCVEGAGVVFSTRRALKTGGWNIVTLLRHKTR